MNPQHVWSKFYFYKIKNVAVFTVHTSLKNVLYANETKLFTYKKIIYTESKVKQCM